MPHIALYADPYIFTYIYYSVHILQFVYGNFCVFYRTYVYMVVAKPSHEQSSHELAVVMN